MKPPIRLLWLKGIYFFITGVWPILHLTSFMAVSGPKIDTWLVKTVGALITVVALTLLTAAKHREYQPAIGVLAIGSAVSLLFVDVYYAMNDVIWDIYLLDAVAEFVIISAWAWWLVKEK